MAHRRRGKVKIPNISGYQSTVVDTGNLLIVLGQTYFMESTAIFQDKKVWQKSAMKCDCKFRSRTYPHGFIKKKNSLIKMFHPGSGKSKFSRSHFRGLTKHLLLGQFCSRRLQISIDKDVSCTGRANNVAPRQATIIFGS